MHKKKKKKLLNEILFPYLCIYECSMKITTHCFQNKSGKRSLNFEDIIWRIKAKFLFSVFWRKRWNRDQRIYHWNNCNKIISKRLLSRETIEESVLLSICAEDLHQSYCQTKQATSFYRKEIIMKTCLLSKIILKDLKWIPNVLNIWLK